jgi:glutamate:Na+ symporter, ESS family
MEFSWKVVIDAGCISVALLVATFIRSKVPFFQRFLIPNALTAGFILLPFYNYLFPALGYTEQNLGQLVYHLLNISFIAMTLRAAPKGASREKNGAVLGMSSGILLGYSTQALLGLGLTLLFMPALFPAFGLFLPLGFALGPGQAYAIGKGWEGMGFEGASTVGLSIAAIGYLWACFGGIFLINLGVKKGWLEASKLEALKDKAMLSGVIPAGREKPEGGRLTTDSEAIDSFSFHIAMVLFAYLLSYLVLLGLTSLLALAGPSGKELGANLWGINFIFSSFVALVLRKVIDAIGLGRVLDDDTLTRTSGFAVDFMVAGSVAAITIAFVGKYWLPIVLMSTLCGLMTTLIVPWFCSRIFRDHRFERMLMIYGVSTGTLSTGLALLRIMDPEFKTRVASDYMLSAGLTFALAIPFILSINFPAYAATRRDMTYYWIMMGVAAAYLAFVLVSYFSVARERGLKRPGELWMKE